MTVLFTWWLPAALQLSFFVSGLLSFGQASLFKMPGFRAYFNMSPLPAAPVASSTTTGGKPPSPYKGSMKIRAPLTTQQLNSAFQENRKQSLLEKAKNQLMDNTKEIRGAAGSMVSKTKSSLTTRQEKIEKKARDEYEKRRQTEIAAELDERRRERQEARRRKMKT